MEVMVVLFGQINGKAGHAAGGAQEHFTKGFGLGVCGLEHDFHASPFGQLLFVVQHNTAVDHSPAK
jgi:hypothetical protein